MVWDTYAEKTVQETRELFLQDVFNDMHKFERGILGRPTWDDMAPADKRIVHGAFPDLFETVTAFMDRYDAMDSKLYQWENDTEEQITSTLPVDTVADSDRNIYLKTIDADEDSHGRTRLSTYLHRHERSIRDAESPEDLQSLYDTDNAEPIVLSVSYDDWTELLWDVIRTGDPSAQERLQPPEQDDILQSYAADIQQIAGERLDTINHRINSAYTKQQDPDDTYAS